MATLATVKGVNRALVEQVPSEPLDNTVSKGAIRFLYDYYIPAAGDNFGTAGIIRIFNIPKGARLIDFEVNCGDAGATGTFSIGWAASRELNTDLTPKVPSGPAAIMNGVVCSVAVSRQKMDNSVSGFLKKFDAEVEVQVDFTAATTAAGGIKFEFFAIIVLD